MSSKKIYRIGSILIVLLALAAHQSLLLAGGRIATSLRVMLQPDALPRALQELRDTHSAELIVQRSWLLTQQVGAYDFHTALEQTTYHAPALTNVGRPAQVESIYLEGAMDTSANAFQLAIWQGSSVLQRDQAYEVRAEGDHTYGRTAGGQWEEIEDVTTLFAPNRDTLAYLHGIKNVRDVSLTADNYRHFSFDMDGPAFAEYMRRQLEDELRRAGKLPAGITLDTPQVYHGVIGAGELWLTSAGLPEQLNVTLNFPQQADGQRVRAVIRTDFANFDTDRLAHSDTLWAAVLHSSPLWLANQFSRMALINLADVGGALGLLMVLALGALWVVWFGRKPSVQIALNVVLIGAIVLTPLLQSARVRAFSLEQAAGQQEVTATQTQSDGQRAGNDSVWNPNVAPLAVAEAKADATLALAAARNPLALSPQRAINAPVAQAAANQSTGDSDGDGVSDANEPPACIGQSDCDGDGLTDLQELRLGTRLNDVDSDGDNLRDDLEVKGFEIGGRRWYANPNNGDTNGDGILDTLECWNENTALDFSAPVNVACNRDTDGDGVPDLFTYDNDGDGVDDTTDLSPFQREATIFDATTPFTLQSNGLTPNEPLFIDFQMVPTTADQISYARNVLDWPNNDTRGQLIRTNDTTFSTYMAQELCHPRRNGDMRLVPLVEIKMPATDADKILPVTDVLTVTRSAKAYETITTGSGDKQKSAEQIWLQAQLAFRGDHGNTTVFFTALTDQANAPLTVDTVQIVQSTCAANDSAQPVVQTTSVTQPWVLDQIALPDLMDGHHAIVFEKGSGDALRTLCMPLGDVANGTLTGGKLFDQKQLDAYGITLRDIVDQTGRATHVIAYLPANVVTGQTGCEKQAFGARMIYWPTTGVTSLGAAQEVRLVWMVQLLDDRGDTQIVHAYRNESWRLAGLRARQDIAMRSAVIYQEPDAAVNGDEATKSLHARLWNASVGLDAVFAHGGADRLPLDAQLVGHLVEQGYVPQDALGSVVNNYESQDEIARVASEVTPGILAKFIADGKYKAGYDHALLIFAREEEYKTARWAGGNMLSLPAATDTLASYSWKPFRYTSGAWEAFPAKEYLDLLQVRLRDVLVADQALAADPLFAQAASAAERVTLRAGIAFANQMFALGMLFGTDRIVARNNTPVAVVAQPNPLAATLKSGVGTAGAALKFIAKEMVVDLAQNVFTNRATVQTVETFEFASEEVLSAVRSAQAERTNLTILGEVAQGRIAQRITTLQELTLNHKLLGAVAVAAPVAALALILGTMASENPTVGGAVDLAMPVINSALAIQGAISAVNNALTKVGEAGGLAKAMDAAAPLSRAAKIGIVVGLVLSVGIAVGVFIAQWVAGAFSITDLGFTAALSAVIATVIVAVLLLAISLIPIVGPIIVAVLGLIDTLIAGVCAISKAYGLDLNKKATLQIPRTGAKLSFCAGITGLLTEGVRFLLFSQTVLVGNMTDSDRLTTSNFSVNLTNPEQGFQVGNSIKPALRIDNKIKLVAQPFDWKSAVYFWQLNWDNLDNTTHRYDLTTDKTNRDVSTGEMESEWQEFKDGRLTGSHAHPAFSMRIHW
ncbi:MAG: hypothetical protein R2932_45185 [Caldilineaceae bacterium]